MKKIATLLLAVAAVVLGVFIAKRDTVEPTPDHGGTWEPHEPTDR